MCQIISHESYTKCGHTWPCGFKYPLKPCSNPDGDPSTNTAGCMERGMQPERFCSEEKWTDMTLTHEDAVCPRCEDEWRKREMTMLNKMDAGWKYVYTCCHERVMIEEAEELLVCFSAGLRPKIGLGARSKTVDPQGERLAGFNLARECFAFSWRKYQSLPLVEIKRGSPCPECRRRKAITELTEYPATSGFRSRKPLGLKIEVTGHMR